MADKNAAGDPFEMFRRIWGPLGLPVPGMAMPTLDPAEVEKRIAELRSVEGWLTLNLNMVRLSIQGLEVQKAALAAMRGGVPEGASAEPEAAAGETRAGAKTASAAAPGAAEVAGAMLWPWQLMQQMMTAGTTAPAREAEETTPAPSQPEPSPAAAQDAGTPGRKKA